jgi:hypothetical protein
MFIGCALFKRSNFLFDQGPTIVHGSFRALNRLFSGTGIVSWGAKVFYAADFQLLPVVSTHFQLKSIGHCLLKLTIRLDFG